MEDFLYKLPKATAKLRNPPLPAIENVEDSYEVISDDDLEGRGIEKPIKHSNIFDIYTRLEVLPGLKLHGHTDTLTEASNLIDELYKRGEIENEQQYRKALDNFYTQ